MKWAPVCVVRLRCGTKNPLTGRAALRRGHSGNDLGARGAIMVRNDKIPEPGGPRSVAATAEPAPVRAVRLRCGTRNELRKSG